MLTQYESSLRKFSLALVTGLCSATLFAAAANTPPNSVPLPPPPTAAATAPAPSANAGPTTATAAASAQPTPGSLSTPVPKPAATPTMSKAQVASTTIIPTPPPVSAKAYLLIDADSGYVIAQQNADQRLAPASLTKLMTMYVASGALKSGRIHLSDPVMISDNAWRTGGSRMFVQVGTQVPVKDLVNGIIVASGNDACVAMAELIAGNEASFVDLMNKTANELGMKGTHYADATGLPNPQNYTTPYDLAILSRSIINHYPEDYKWYSQKWMLYNNIRQPNRNLLLWRDDTVDGLKTGHTDDAGYCLVASAKRQQMRLIAIIMGDTSSHQRATDAEALLNYGFHFYETHKLYAKEESRADPRIWFGKYKKTSLGLGDDLFVTIPMGQYKQLQATMIVDPNLHAPIVKGQAYGTVQVNLGNQVVASQPLVALTDNPTAGPISRLIDHVSMYVSGWFHRS